MSRRNFKLRSLQSLALLLSALDVLISQANASTLIGLSSKSPDQSPPLKAPTEQTDLTESYIRDNADFVAQSLVPFYVKTALESHFFKDGQRQDTASVLKELIIKARVSPEHEFMLRQNVQQETPEIGEQCLEHVSMFLNHTLDIILNPLSLLNATTWPLQMIDSWGKVPEGILSGHVSSFGDWDECVHIEVEGKPFEGQYCWTYHVPSALLGDDGASSKKAVSLPELISNMLNPVVTAIIPAFASCVPSSCSKMDVQLILVGLYSNFNFFPAVADCSVSAKPDLSAAAIFMICFLGIFGLMLVLGTLLDALISYRDDKNLRKGTGMQTLLAFSLLTNIFKWQNTKGGDAGFGCIHGLRFFSTCWVVLSHTFYVINQPTIWNLVDMNNVYKRDFSFYFILNGYFSVDTFFTMSGLLACHSIMKALDKTQGRINVFKLYLHRYLRLTPTYAILIGLIATMYPYLGSGIGFQSYANLTSKVCQKYWWHNLLYINNLFFYDPAQGEQRCEGESWYISNDMQFFILSPLFVYLLWRWQRIGMGVLGAVSLASIITPGIIVGTAENEPPTMVFWKATDTSLDVYQKPWNRIGSYLVGIWMGYILSKTAGKKISIPKLAVVGGWMLSTSVALALLLGIMPYFDPNNDDNAVGAGFYAGLSKFCWGMVICWIIFACVKGYGGWVNSLLSWKAFIPLGRLTFCVYVSSLSMQMLYHQSVQQPTRFNIYNTVYVFFSHIVMCFLVGFVLTMAFESPFIQLEKILFAAIEGTNRSAPPIVNKDQNGNDGPFKPAVSVNALSKNGQSSNTGHA